MRPPVANVDQALYIVSAVTPDFSLLLLDRFLVYHTGTAITATIYLTKTDLAPHRLLLQITTALAGYQAIGYAVLLPTAALHPATLLQVQASFAHKHTIFTGQTGAGLSTYINTLVPGLDLATDSLSRALNRGKTTTRTTDLYPITGGLVAHTPGFSSLGLLDDTLQHLRDRFPTFVALAPHCKFRGCQTVSEPQCAVKADLDAD